MKFVTYTLDGGAQPRFGFKKNEYIIDVIRASIWANENNGDSSFFEIPSSLKRALENWDTHFVKLRQLDTFLPDIKFQSHSGGGKPIAILEKTFNFYLQYHTLHLSEIFMHLNNMFEPHANLGDWICIRIGSS